MTPRVRIVASLLLGACFVGSVVACFSAPREFFWWALLGAMGTGIAAALCFLYPAARKPFEKVYVHENWIFDPKMERYPILIILEKDHRMGSRPRLQFRQGDHVFPWESDSHGNITIVRDNHSIGRFRDMGVIVSHEV